MFILSISKIGRKHKYNPYERSSHRLERCRERAYYGFIYGTFGDLYYTVLTPSENGVNFFWICDFSINFSTPSEVLLSFWKSLGISIHSNFF